MDAVMSLMDPELLGDVVQLSPGPLILGLVVGIALWLFGWRWHRFWIVLATTVAAGTYGLLHGEQFRSQPMIAAPLLALAAGVLALALVRMLAFLTGGVAGLLIAQSAVPHWDQPLICFVLSGLIGLFLFRWCWMALTSILGVILLSYCGLGVAHQYKALDAMRWVDQTGELLNWILAGAAFLGLAFQFLLNRKGRGRRHDRDDDQEYYEVDSRRNRWFRRAG